MKTNLTGIILSILFLALIFQFSGCSSVQKNAVANVQQNSPANSAPETTQINRSTQNVEADLEKNQSIWLEKNIKNYNLTASLVIDGINSSADPVLIKVRDGKAVSIEPVLQSDKKSTMYYKRYETVETMFKVIKKESDKKASVNVVYNKEFGYPEKLSIVYENKPSHAWSNFKVTKFEVIK